MSDRGYAKVFSSILTSSLWQESAETRIVWMTMLVLADKFGDVVASVPGLAHQANVPIDACESALEVFTSPDRYSRSKELEGRRIQEIPGGWRLVNFEHYRSMMSYEERREYKRRKEAERRARIRSEQNGKGEEPEKPAEPRPVQVSPRESAAEPKPPKEKQGPPAAKTLPEHETPPPPDPYRTHECLQAWEAFKTWRMTLRKRITKEAARLMFKRATEYQLTPEHFVWCLEDSIQNGWTGCFFVEQMEKLKTSKRVAPPAEDADFGY